MKVYIVMRYDNHEYHVGHVYDNYYDAAEEAGKDLMKFDMVVIRDLVEKDHGSRNI